MSEQKSAPGVRKKWGEGGSGEQRGGEWGGVSKKEEKSSSSPSSLFKHG